jgi:hypothetical protein
MGTTMEWTSCTVLMLSYVTSRGDPKKADLKSWDDVGKEGKMVNATAWPAEAHPTCFSQ